MSAEPEHAITEEERGNNVSPRRRLMIFALVIGFISAAVVGIAYASDTAPSADETRSTRTVAPTVDADTPAAGDIAQAELVDAEDTRIWQAVSRGTMTAKGVTTIVLDRRPEGAYTLGDLISLGAAKKSGPRVVTLVRPVVVRTGATLSIKAPGGTLRLAGSGKGFTSIVAWGGKLALSGGAGKPLTVVGWSRAAKAADTTVADGRSYVRAHSGKLVTRHVAFEDLGFWSGRTGGVAATGTTFDPGRAQILDTSVRRTQTGIYLYDTRNVTISDTTITGPTRNGIELDRSPGARLTDVTITRAGLSGIHAHDHSNKLRIAGSSVTDSGTYGISVDGRPRADGPNALGYSVVNGSGLTISRTTVTGNVSGGVRLTGTSYVTLSRVDVVGDRRPLRLLGRSTTASIRDSDLTSTRGPVIEVESDARDVELVGNTITGTTNGVTIADADVDVLGNSITIDEGAAVAATGRATRGTVDDNTVVGAGRRAFDVSDVPMTVAADGNDESRWKTTHPFIEWIEDNPFAPLWVAILLIPAIGFNFILRRFRVHRDLRRLTEETTIAMARTRRDDYLVSHGRKPATPPVEPAAPDRRPTAPTHQPLPPHPVVTASTAPDRADVDAPDLARTDRRVVRGAMGQFGSAEDLAVHAVLEAGRTPEHVARTLQVPVSVVVGWVQKSLADVPS